MNGRRDSSLSGPPLRRFLGIVLLAVLAAQLALSWYAWRLADDLVVPALERKAGNVGLALARNLTRALATGMPWEKLNGVDAWFDATLAANPDLAYAVLTDDAGHVLVRSGRGGEVIAPEQYVATTREVERRYVTYGQVLVGVDRRFITARIQTIRNDTGALLLAGLVLAGQLAWFAGTLGFAAPLRQAAELLARLAAGDFRYRIGGAGQRKLALAADQLQRRLNAAFAEVARLAADQRRWARAQPVLKRLRSHYRFADPGGPRELELDRAASARLLVCAVLLAEALSQAMLPSYADSLASAVPAWLQAVLPQSAALGGLALALPLARDWTATAGRRPVYLFGTLVAAIGLAAAGYVADYAALVLGRATTGLGYALLLTAALSGVEPERERRSARRTTALAAGALAVAQLCGPPLGGVLADTAGPRAVFVTAAWLLLGAAGLGLWLLDERLPQAWRAHSRLLPAPARRADRPELAWQVLNAAAGAALRF
ncbi:MAG TPA: MFS transporter, partial [Telluria sp.]|nr:MFS transporter [Telluria sp.]